MIEKLPAQIQKYFLANKLELILVLVSLLSLVAYVITIWPPFGMLCIAAFLGLVVNDFIKPKKKKKTNLIHDIAIPIASAIAIWVLLTVVLQTATPLNVVTSCSMVPVLERGDLIVVQGGNIDAPTVQTNGSISEINAIVHRSQCTAVKRNGQEIATQCTSNLTVNNQTINTLRTQVLNSSVIVYEANPQSYGLIVHRAIVKLTNGNESYYLTKGDNNQIADQEAGITPVPPEKIQGKVILRIPLIGYFKLFLYGQFNDPQGCDTTIK